MQGEQENDGFVSAADFFRSQQAPPPGGKVEEPRRPVRESLLVVARNSQVKNKINAFDRGGGPVAGFARPAPASGAAAAGPAILPPPRRVGAAPALGAIAEEAVGAAPTRRHAAVVSTATAGTAAPPRRHAAAAVATAVAPAAPQPPQPVLPSPATKQELAERRHEARFPSIMFRPPQQQATPPRRRSLDSGSGIEAGQAPHATAEQASRGPRPMPAVLALARASLSPQLQQQQQERQLQPTATEPGPTQRQRHVLPQTVAAALAAEAAAAVRGSTVESEDEDGRFVDAESGGGSGGLSLEGSAVWADAHDQHSPLGRLPGSQDAPHQPARAPAAEPAAQPAANLVICEEDDAASVASDASTVVHDHSHSQLWAEQGAAEEERKTDEGAAPPAGPPAAQPAASGELAAEPAELPDLGGAGALPVPGESLLLAAAAEVQMAHWVAADEAQPLASGPSADGEVFQCASIALPAMEAPPAYRASLSPAVSGRRCSMAATQELAEATADAEDDAETSSVRVSLAAGIADAADPAPAGVGPDAAELPPEPPGAAALSAAEPPGAPGSAFFSAAQAKPEQLAAEPSGHAAMAPPALHAEASRISLASMASSAAAPSLHIEYSEASLRYSVDQAPHSPRSQHSHSHSLSQELSAVASAANAAADGDLLPPAAAAIPQQRRPVGVHSAGSPPAVPANTPASPVVPSFATGAEEQPSQPTGAAAIAQAIEQAAAEHEAELRASLASSQDGNSTAGPASAAAVPPAAATAAAASLEQAAASPVPPTPYAATEYDGEDVVMMDIDTAPRPTTGRRLPPGVSRFAAEAQAAAVDPSSPGALSPAAAVAPAIAAAEAAGACADAQQGKAAGTHAAGPATEHGQTTLAAKGGLPGEAQPASYSSGAPQLAAKPGKQPAEPVPQADAAVEEVAAPSTETAAAVGAAPAQEKQQQMGQAGTATLPELAPAEAAARRSRAGRLSMPAGGPAGRAGHARRTSRLSLPSSGPWAGGEEAAAFAPRPKLAASPVATEPAVEEEQQAEQQQQQQQQQQQGEQAEVPAAGAEQDAAGGEAEVEPAPFIIRSRLQAEADEVLACLAAAPVMEVAPTAESGARGAGALDAAAAGSEEVPHGSAEPAAAQAEPQPAAEDGAAAAQGDEAALAAAAAFGARPRLAMSPAVSTGSGHSVAATENAAQQQAEEGACVPGSPDHQWAGHGADGAARAAAAASPEPAVASEAGSASQQAATAACGEEQRARGYQALAAAAFAAEPRLATSPAVSGGSQGRASSRGSPASRPQAEVAYAVAAAAAASLREQQQQAYGAAEAAPSAQLAEGLSGDSSRRQQAHQQQQAAWLEEPPAMSSNPLAGAGATPGAGARRLSHSPAPSGLSAGAVSNNPMYAGTPGHPTPPSVNLKSFSGRLSGGTAGTPQSAGSGGSTPASTGIKLAEKLHQVAEQLQNPAAPQGLAALATPAGARLGGGGRTPGTGRFAFADDVQAIFQALDTHTPAAVLGQPALGRAAAAATTVQRAQGPGLSRFSFGSAGNCLLDLDSYDANGNRAGQAGPTPLLRQQLLGGTPAGLSAAASAAGAASVYSGVPAAAATPLEVKALRDEVKALREETEALRLQNSELVAQHDEMVGLLGGYQSSIRELQDKHSVLVVRLQGETAALKAENEELRRAHCGVDGQFRTLYDKYLPLKKEAEGLREELAALQKRVVAEELKAHKAASDGQAARQELAASQQRCQDYKAALVEAQADVAAAREAEQRLQQQLAGEQRRVEKALAGKEAELGELRAKYGALTKQYDEAVHKVNLAKQARERAQAEVHRKEEEVVSLEVRVKEYEGALREYKRENGKFFEMKERYKAAIAGLEREVEAKEREKKELLGMCNELMTRLEREGLAS